jgi:hypothetical protein
MKFSAWIVVMLPVLLVGCNDASTQKGADAVLRPKIAPASTPAEISRNMVLRYNQLLSEGYKTTDMTKLQEVATPELSEKAYYHMAAIGEGNSRLVSELKKIDFIETDCSIPEKWRVVTREKWDFAYADIKTGNRSNEVKDYIYDVQYLMGKRGGRWIITEITATGEERKELPTWGKMFRKQ